jgi:radical SAM superfamily enzyme YgiQ (UPF0313 family)
MHLNAPSSHTCRVLLVYPRFNNTSFWNFKETCNVLGARYPTAPLGLITVAALLPSSWRVRLVDCNTVTLTNQDIDEADLVMTGGMLPQQPDTLAIIERCQARGKPVVVGGPDATSSPQLYAHADFLVLGEAESILAQFVAAWIDGARAGRFEAEKFTADVASSPIPRFDLLTFSHYLYLGVQFSRGCPFNCEFCDIIELYGRVPRTKTNTQMLAELDRIYALGYRGHVDFVDDNLVGNKKALKLFLPHLIAWQKAHGYPFEFGTEASVNLADDDQLLKMLGDANFFVIFVGIESPDADTLIAAQKKQNIQRSLSARIDKIYAAGITVTAGFILGFDSERDRVAEGIIDCIENTTIPVCMVGLLYALPNTQLTRRLEREGRLHAGHDVASKEDFGDQCTDGLNFVTARPRREILADYLTVLNRIYSPAAYFSRVREMGRRLKNNRAVLSPSISGAIRDSYRSARLLWAMTVMRPSWARPVWSTLADCIRHNPTALRGVVQMMSLYLHMGPFSRELAAKVRAEIFRIDRGEEEAYELLPAASLVAARM